MCVMYQSGGVINTWVNSVWCGNQTEHEWCFDEGYTHKCFRNSHLSHRLKHAFFILLLSNIKRIDYLTVSADTFIK